MCTKKNRVNVLLFWSQYFHFLFISYTEVNVVTEITVIEPVQYSALGSMIHISNIMLPIYIICWPTYRLQYTFMTRKKYVRVSNFNVEIAYV